MTAVVRPDRAPTTSASRLSIRPEDVVGFLAANIILIVAMWVRHGGLDQLGTMAGLATATGQLTALIGTFLSLIQLLLMSRAPWLDAAFGRDRLAFAHRWIGFATLWLIAGHAAFTTVGFALSSGQSVLGEAWLLITTWDFVLMATVSLALLIAVAITSMRLARRSLSYETWYGIHLYAYLAIALGFAHQLVVGTDFVDDPIARIYWVGLYVAAIGTLLVFRFGAPIVANVRHRFRVANVVQEGPGVVSIYLTGHDLDRFPARAGQYLTIRFMTRGWWRSHPYSLSAQPNGRWLRVTIKDLGDDSAHAHELPIGTWAVVEGAYGNLTTERQTADRALLIAGGIGVTPLRAILEELAGRVPVTLVYRARNQHDLVFRRELDILGARPNVVVDYQVGSRRSWGARDPLVPDELERLVPDIAQREVYLCGPSGLMRAAEESVLELGVPARRIHLERFFDD
ncbi:MAG: ferric reductase-like transmembrane domain-containing protein [Chloroflexota bacterium]